MQVFWDSNSHFNLIFHGLKGCLTFQLKFYECTFYYLYRITILQIRLIELSWRIFYSEKKKKHLRPLQPWPQGPQATSLDLFVKLDHLKIASCCDSWTSMGWWYSNLHILLKPRVHSESNLKKIHFPNFHQTKSSFNVFITTIYFFLYLSSKSTYFFNVPFFFWTDIPSLFLH